MNSYFKNYFVRALDCYPSISCNYCGKNGQKSYICVRKSNHNKSNLKSKNPKIEEISQILVAKSLSRTANFSATDLDRKIVFQIGESSHSIPSVNY